MQGKIGKRTVDALKAAERDVFLWDSEMHGFGVKVTPKGRKVYVLQYQAGGGGRGAPVRRVTIGTHGSPWTAEKAREEAGRLLAEVKLGQDPAAAKAQRRKEPTVAEVADRYLAEHVDVHNRASTAAEVKRVVENLIKPELGSTKISALSRSRIKEWHSGMRTKPYEANRALAYLSKMLALAASDWELRSDNPCRGLQRFPERKRERFFSDEELRTIGQTLTAIAAEGVEPAGCVAAVRLLALTGMRTGELLSLRWDDVEADGMAVRLRDAKAGARTVWLGRSAAAMIAALPRTGTYLVHGADPEAPLSGAQLRHFWDRVRARTGIADSRLHDFRHTAGTFAAQAGFNAFMVRDLLGHKTLAMTGRYVERAADPYRAAAEAVGGRIGAAMSAPEGGNVVAMKSGKGNTSAG